MVRPLRFDAIEAARRNWEEHDLPEPDAMAAATSIMRAEQIVSAAVEQALRPLGLTFARWELLMLLTFSKHGSLPMTKIGDRLMVHPTGISKLVDPCQRRPALAEIRTLLTTQDTRSLVNKASRTGGKPRRAAEKALATRAALIDLAAELFSEEGYIQTSIRDIAKRGQLTTGAI